jgi:N-sulfoglucosamine sulfohydrolase
MQSKFIFLGIIISTLLICKGAIAQDTEKPNIIIWVADDQYLESVGCYGGNPEHTPNIDKLAREGLKFTRAYSTASVCTPARSALYTGMYPIKNGAHPNHSGLKKDIPSMPNIMRNLGYKTGLVGKEGVHKIPTRPTNLFTWDVRIPHTKTTIKGAEHSEKSAKKHRMMDYEKIDKFISDTKEPFCLFVASSLPHGPEMTTIENGLTGYEANNWSTDLQVGRYMKMLEKAGKTGNTVIIFVSDNGSNTPRSKYTLFEPGIHIPMIITWPGHVKPNTETDALVDFTDVMPTLIDLAGGESHSNMDGKSLQSLMKGEDVIIHDDLYSSFTCLGVNDVNDPYPIRAVVTEQYKLIRYLNPGIVPPKGTVKTKSPEYLLFDLKNDPKELKNLAMNKKYQSIMKDMMKRLNKWTVVVGDKGLDTELEAIEMFPGKIDYQK